MSGPALIQHDGLWWPSDDTRARPVILRDRDSDVANLLKHTPGRRAVVQAGANVGAYPLALADHFELVVTAEPDPNNYACLQRNLDARDSLRRVLAFHCAFGADSGVCAPVVVEADNCGAHRVTFGSGDVPVITVDSLGLKACDAIWADVEGAELPLLCGAERTIARFGPTIRIEDKGLNAAFGVANGAAQAWLAARGYAEIDSCGRDKVFRRATQ